MSPQAPSEIRALERQRYWQGQRLRLRDFRDDQSRDLRLRAWHNRALHGAFGIASGLDPVNTDAGPARLHCGIGYDCAGRTLILAKDADVPPLPATAVPLLLVLRPVASADGCTCCRTPGPACEMCSDRVPVHAKPAWVIDDEWDGIGVPVARMIRQDSGYVPDPTYTPPFVRPLARPRLAAGETVHGNTPWEIWTERLPNSRGFVEDRPVGVQTVIDTSASGFTSTPRYFATLQSKGWTIPTATDSNVPPPPEFAPAYFAHVAKAAPDGFTFRLLLSGISLRSDAAVNTVTHLSEITREGSRAFATVENAADFLPGDALVQVRPRGEIAAGIASADVDLLTLRQPFALPDGTLLAIGNLPRRSSITAVARDEFTTIPLTASLSLSPRDALAVTGDEPRSVGVASVAGKVAVLQESWPELAGMDVLVFSYASAVKIADVEKNEEGESLILSFDDPVPFAKGDFLVRHGAAKSAPSLAMRVVAVAQGNRAVVVQPPIAGVLKNQRVSAARAPVHIAEVGTIAGDLRVQVDDAGYFEPGDAVAVEGRLDRDPAVITSVDAGEKELTLPGSFEAAAGNTLIAANRIAASLVEGVTSPTSFTVARGDFFHPGNVVWALDNETFPAPAGVQAVVNNTVQLRQPLKLARGQTIVIGEFPAVAAIIAVPAADVIQVRPQDLIPAGSWIALLTDSAAPFVIAQITGTEADGTLRLHRALTGARVGDLIGVVHFTDITRKTADAEDGQIQIQPEFEPRASGDLAARLHCYADNSPVVHIANIAANVLELAGDNPALLPASGLIPQPLIDGGLLALASFTPSQPRLRLASADPPSSSADLRVTGPDAGGVFRSIDVHMTSFDSATGAIELSAPGQSFAFRPELVRLVRSFNEDFPRAFAAFAQRRQLAVSWVACQRELTYPYPCSDESPCDPCMDAGDSQEDPCR